MKRVLRGCSPHIHPHRWIVVNSVVLIWSLILINRIRIAQYDVNEQTEVEFEYLVYNFLTCGVWLIEVTFNVLDHKRYFDAEGTGEESLLQPIERRERSKNEVIAIYIELVLAALFFLDSTSVAFHLTRHQIHRQSEGMVVDVCINMLAYSYLIYRQYVDYRATHDGEQEEDLARSEEDEGQVNSEIV